MPTYSATRNSALCRTFTTLASRTWSDLRDADRHGLSLGEEAITDYLLLDLKRHHPHSVVVKKFTKRQEGKTAGADWEWWFRGGGFWFGARVQAKKLDSKQLRYFKLDHATAKGARRQIDLLIDDAKTRCLCPLYCFYNFWDTTATQPIARCRTYPPKDDHFGCTIADAYSVRRRITTPGLNDILAISLPWMCMVCCEGFVPGPLPMRAYAVATNGLREPEFVVGGDVPPVPVPTREAPQYVARLFELQNQLPDEVDAAEFDLPAHLHGILIIDEREEA